MFILRRVIKSGVYLDTYLDVYYEFILKTKSREEFDERVSLWDKEYLDGLYGLVSVPDTDIIMPLYSNSKYYIMTSDGKTFSNISEK